MAMTLADAIKALGLPITATMQELESKYKKLCELCSPDNKPAEEKERAAELLSKITDAYNVFKNYLVSRNTSYGNSSFSGDSHTIETLRLEYERARRAHEDFLNNTVKPSNREIERLESAIANERSLDKKQKLTDELARLLGKHKLLIAQSATLYKARQVAESKYNAALAQYGHRQAKSA